MSVLLNTTVPGATTPSFAAPQPFASVSAAKSIASGDLNGDGRPDILVAYTGNSTVSALLNTPVTIPSNTATGTIVESNAAIAVQFNSASETVNESADTFSITVSLSAPTSLNILVPFTFGGTAVAGTDYSGLTTSPLSIPAGQTSATITGTLLPHIGSIQTLVFALGSPSNAIVGSQGVNTLTIVEPQPTVQFSAASETVNESAGVFSIAVTLSAISNQAVSVPFTLSGSGTAGVDYSGLSANPLIIPAGQNSGAITGTLLPDDGVNQTIVFTLGAPANATLGATTVNTLTIVEPQPTIQFNVAGETVNESAGTFSIPVVLSAPSTQVVSVPFTLGGSALLGTDYSGVASSPLIIPAGQTSGTITGTLLPDYGASQTLVFTLGTPSNASLGSKTVNTLTIVEPQPTVQFSTASETVNESAGTFSITVNLSTVSNQAVSVPFALSGTAKAGVDFSGVTSSPITFPAGQTSATISGNVLLDFGANQTLIFTLNAPTNASLGSTVVNTLTIVEPQPTIQFDTSSETVNENAGTFSISLSLSAASNQVVSVPFTLGGSAVLGLDYSGLSSNPLTVPAGQTSATITGPLLPDVGPNQNLTLYTGFPHQRQPRGHGG